MSFQRGNATVLVLALGAIGLGLGLFWWLGGRGEGQAELPTRGALGAVRMAEPDSPAGPLPQAPRPASERLAAASAQASSPDPSSILAASLCGFRGRLLLPNGDPVAGAPVRIDRFDTDVFTIGSLIPDADELREPRIAGLEGSSDEEGRFLLTGIWPRGLYVLQAGRGSDLGGAAPLWQIVERTPGPGEIVDLGDLVLRAAGTIVGTVVDDQGDPLPGALVRAADIPAEILALAPLERFHPEGALIVRAEDTPMVLAMPAWVARRIADLPIPSTYTDVEGAFRLTGVEPGESVLIVTAAGFLAHLQPRVEVEAGGTRDVGELELDSGALIEGRVVDGENRPVPGAQVLLAPETASFPVDFAAPAVIADGEGRFALSGLPSRRISSAARRDAGDAWTVQDPEFVGRELVITLPSAHALTVRLLSGAGLAIEQPRLRLLQRPAGGDSEATLGMASVGLLPELEHRSRLRRLEDGRLLLANLQAGQYLLLADSPGHAVSAASIDLVSDWEETLTLAAERAFLVRVVDGEGQGIAGASILAQPTGSGSRLRHGPIACGHTDAEGSLRVTQVDADEVQVTARHPAYGSAQTSGRTSGDEVRLVLEEPGALDGLLTEAGTPPLPGKWIVTIFTFRNFMPVFATPDLEGRFRVEGLQPGTYTVTIQESMQAISSPGGLLGMLRNSFMRFDTVQESVEIRSGQRSVVTLDPARKAEVSGPAAGVAGVALVDGRPAEGMRVVGFVTGGERNWHRVGAEVDATGRFDLGRVPTGNLNLSLQAGRTDRMSLFGEADTLWSERYEVKPDEDLALSIEIFTGSLTGLVLGLDGSPVPACRIRLQREGGGGRGQMSTLSDQAGRFAFQTLAVGAYRLEAEGAQGAKAVLARVEVGAGRAGASVQVRLRRTFRVAGRVELAPFGERPRWIWLTLARQEDALDPEGGRVNENAHVDSEGGFQFEGLLPGVYTGRFNVPGQSGQWVLESPIEVRNADLLNLTLHPVRREPDPPPAPAAR